MKNWMKCMVACMMLFVGTMGVMAQKNIDKVVEELEKSDEASINSVTKRDPKTRKITRVVKTFSLTDIKMAKRLITAFEKDEEYAVSAMKDMPKGRKSAMRVNFTFTFQQDNEKAICFLFPLFFLPKAESLPNALPFVFPCVPLPTMSQE